MNRKLQTILFIILPFLSFGQEGKSRNWELTGYQKSLQGIFVFESPLTLMDTTLTNIFLHNRLNFKWYPNKNFTFRAELRTRYFFGSFHQSLFAPDFKNRLKEDSNDFLNFQIINTGNQTLLHSVFDRLNVEYEKGKWNLTLGRQRINWGIGTLWNPNDLFNAYSFIDFDYEERPGVDALHLNKYIGYSGGIELAVKAADSLSDFVAGFLYKINKWNYDFQFLGGYAKQDVVVGAGWAGPIKSIGFKGELSFFNSTIKDRLNSFSGVLEFDYAFAKGTYFNAGMLYNAADNSSSNLLDFDLEARNLYPYRWALTSTVSHPITPLFQANISIVYSPVNGQPLFLSPVMTYSLAQNVDVDLIGQIIFEEKNDAYKAGAQLFYLRMKWNY